MKLFKKKAPKTRLELFMDHLDIIFETEPEFFNGSNEQPGITSIVYKNLPEDGMITGVTYGLSIADHQDWIKGKPELIITVKSTDSSWAQAAGYIANKLKGVCPFTYGNTINFNAPISEESEMDAFLIFAPSILDQNDFLNINVSDNLPIHLSGIYPIYSTEIALIDEWGLEKFWHHPNFDMFDVNRKRVE